VENDGQVNEAAPEFSDDPLSWARSRPSAGSEPGAPRAGFGHAGTRVKFMIHDRDASFPNAFDEVFRAAGTRIVGSAIQASRMNSVTERWIGSCGHELPDRTLVWNQRHLMTVPREYEGRLQHPPAPHPDAGRAAAPTARQP
jgi:hypothetical protein